MTMFKNEFDFKFVCYFSLLLGVKIFHSLLKDRVDYMEQATSLERGFFIRMVATISFLLILDVSFASYCLTRIIKEGPSMLILYCFEYTVLFITCSVLTIKYFFNIYDSRQENPWTEKSVYLFYVELFTDLIKLICYLCFFIVVVIYYGLPLHIIRDLIVTLQSFLHRVKDLIRYRRATANMDQLYPNATEEELNSTDRTCIICRDEMEAAKKLPCGHLFHFNCLRSWLERQQACPTCRRPVFDENNSLNRAVPPRPNVPNQQLQPPNPPAPLNISPTRLNNPPVQPMSGFGPIGIQTENGITTAIPIVILPQQRVNNNNGARASHSRSSSLISIVPPTPQDISIIQEQLEFLKNLQSEIQTFISSVERRLADIPSRPTASARGSTSGINSAASTEDKGKEKAE